MFGLEKVQAPGCPKCGCNASHQIGAGGRCGRYWSRWKCDFCANEYTLGSAVREPGVVNGVAYNTIHCVCPKCKAKNPPVRSTQGRIRYHKCDNCGQNFKSFEGK